jgi:cell wall-associated NlpC family hydrolase
MIRACLAALCAAALLPHSGQAFIQSTAQKPKSKAPAAHTQATKTQATKSVTAKTPATSPAAKAPVKSAAARKSPSRARTTARKAPPPKTRFLDIGPPPTLVGLSFALAAPPPGLEQVSYRSTTVAPCLPCYEQALERAYSLLLMGLRYKRGGSTPETGFDCSGFVHHVYGTTCHLSIPRSAITQYNWGLPILREELQRGDLVFFRRGRVGWHVGIYVGDGRFIHSPNRRRLLSVSSLNEEYYRKTFLGARRIPPSEIADVGQFGCQAPLLTEDAGQN